MHQQPLPKYSLEMVYKVNSQMVSKVTVVTHLNLVCHLFDDLQCVPNTLICCISVLEGGGELAWGPIGRQPTSVGVS